MTADVSHEPVMTAHTQHLSVLPGSRFLYISAIILIPNCIVLGANYLTVFNSFQNVTLWLALNFVLGLLVLAIMTLDRFLVRPLKRIWQTVHGVLAIMAQESADEPKRPLLHISDLTSDVARFATLAQEYYHKHQEITQALEEARRTLVQVTIQQEALLTRTSREIAEQYRYVLTYANHLEEYVQHQSSDPMLRYDFDDVCESSFNLKLIAGSLGLLNSSDPHPVSAVSVAYVIQQTLLALAPSLDRRSMKLSTINVDETLAANTSPAIISQVFWMMLLGIIRYADDESTLQMGCQLSHNRQEVIISVIVSELSPGRLSEDERTAHFLRQIRHSSPHLFAETIREHASLHLAELLLARVLGRMQLIQLSSYACEVQLVLPCIEDANEG